MFSIFYMIMIDDQSIFESFLYCRQHSQCHSHYCHGSIELSQLSCDTAASVWLMIPPGIHSSYCHYHGYRYAIADSKQRDASSSPSSTW